MSSVEENEYFYDAVSLENSQDVSYYSFPTRSLSSNFETNLSGLAMTCRQPSRSDQVPDLSEEGYVTQKSQVSELNETYLVEGKRQWNNDDSHSRILSDMIEKETHVDNMSFDKQTDICQILFDIIEDQSEVYRRAETAISGLPQSNQWRLGKSDGKPGTPLPATNLIGRVRR